MNYFEHTELENHNGPTFSLSSFKQKLNEEYLKLQKMKKLFRRLIFKLGRFNKCSKICSELWIINEICLQNKIIVFFNLLVTFCSELMCSVIWKFMIDRLAGQNGDP